MVNISSFEDFWNKHKEKLLEQQCKQYSRIEDLEKGVKNFVKSIYCVGYSDCHETEERVRKLKQKAFGNMYDND